ncbi:MAG: Pacmanvirus, partial [Bacteroidota bacterium]
KQKPYQHYGGSGCNLCAIDEVHENQKIDFNQFVERSIEKHGTRYDYSEAVYNDIFTPIHIICSHHGSFLQIPRDHYRGSGCPKCISSRGENAIRIILQELEVEFVEQKTFDDLVYKSKLKCDFFLPELNTVIEYNGLQHYEPVSIFGGIEGLIETQNRDLLKYEYLDSRGIDLIIIRYDIEDIKEYLQERLMDYLKD